MNGNRESIGGIMTFLKQGPLSLDSGKRALEFADSFCSGLLGLIRGVVCSKLYYSIGLFICN